MHQENVLYAESPIQNAEFFRQKKFSNTISFQKSQALNQILNFFVRNKK